MYENAKISTLAAGQCTPPEQQLSDNCNNILGMSREIDNIADAIKSNLFGPATSETQNAKEPYSLDDILTIIKATLESAYKTLADIRSRLLHYPKPEPKSCEIDSAGIRTKESL